MGFTHTDIIFCPVFACQFLYCIFLSFKLHLHLQCLIFFCYFQLSYFFLVLLIFASQRLNHLLQLFVFSVCLQKSPLKYFIILNEMINLALAFCLCLLQAFLYPLLLQVKLFGCFGQLSLKMLPGLLGLGVVIVLQKLILALQAQVFLPVVLCHFFVVFLHLKRFIELRLEQRCQFTILNWFCNID